MSADRYRAEVDRLNRVTDREIDAAIRASGATDRLFRRLTISPWFYAGPYVPSGVIYGHGLPSHSHWLVPGYDPDSHRIDMYERPIPSTQGGQP